MNAVIFETVVTEEHQLHSALPSSLPTGTRLRVIIEPLPEEMTKLTPLAQKLRAIRQRGLANGLQLRSVESIIDEVQHA